MVNFSVVLSILSLLDSDILVCSKKCGTLNIENNESAEADTEYDRNMSDGSDDDTAIANASEGDYEESSDQQNIASVQPKSHNLLFLCIVN